MTSSEKTYNVFLTDGRSEVWNDQMMASGGAKLFDLHPDAQVTVDSPYEDGVEYSPNATFNISLADGRQEQWTHDMWKQGGARLRELHPDAQVSVTSPYTRENHEAVSAPQNVPLVDVNKMMAGARKAVAGVQNLNATQPQGLAGAVKSKIDANRSQAEAEAFHDNYKFVPELDEEGNEKVDEYGNPVGSWELRSDEEAAALRKERADVTELENIYKQLNYLERGREDSNEQGLKEIKAEIDLLTKELNNPEGNVLGSKQKRERLAELQAKYDKMDTEKRTLTEAMRNNPIYQQQVAEKKDTAKEMADAMTVYRAYQNEVSDETFLGKARNVNPFEGMDETSMKAAGYFAERALKTLGQSDDSKSGFAAFLKAHGDTFTDVDFWDQGLRAIGSNIIARAAFDKIRGKIANYQDETLKEALTDEDFDNLLTEDEKEVIRQFVNCSEAEALRAYDVNNMYGAGKTSAESLGFMAQFILTGNVLKGAETAMEKGFAKWLSKTARSGIEKGLKNKGLKELGLRVGLGAMKTLEAVSVPVAKALPMTIMQTGFYKTYAENLTSRDQFGNLEHGYGAENIWDSYRDAFVETWSEMALSPALKVFGETFGHYAKLGLDKLGEVGEKAKMFATKLKDLYKIVHNADALSLLRDAAFDGYLEEMGEEVLGAAVRQMWDENSWNEFWKADNISSMAVAFAPMSVIGAGTSMANYRSRVKKFEEALPAVQAMLRKAGVSDAQMNDILARESFDLSDVGNKVKALIAPVLKEGNLTPEQYKQVYNFAVATGEAEVSKALMKGLAADERRDKKSELTETYRDFVNADGKVRYYDTEDGRVMVRTDLPAENGKYFGVTATGDIVWVDAGTQLTEVDEEKFLDSEVKADKDRSELARTRQEAQQKESEFRRALNQNPNVRLIGADGQKHDYTFVGWDVDGTAIVQTTGKNGQPIQEKFTKRAIANALGVDMSILTDDELAERNIAAQRKKNILSRKATSYSGETIAFSGVQSKLIGVRPSENGFTVLAEQGGQVISREVSEEDLQFMLMGFSMKEALGEESAASDVVESANAEEQKLTNEEIAKRYTDANGVVDEVNFLDQEPEAYAQYRDTIKSKEDTDNLIKANAEAKQSEYEKAKAAMDKETNPAVKDQMEANVNELKAQADRLRALYEKRTASATSAGALSSAEAQKVRDQYISAGLTEDEIDALAVRNIEDAMKEQESVGEVDATDPEEAIRQKEANEKAKADAQNRIDYWKSVLASAASAQSQSLENAQLQHRAKMASLTKAMAQAKTEELRNTIASEMIEVDNQFNEQAKKYVDEAVGDLNTANTRVEVCTSLNIAEKMRGCRASAKSINTVARAVQGGAKISGFFDASSNTIYVVADNAKDVADIRETFTHEEQHRKTAAGMLDTKMKEILAKAGLKGKLGRQFLENSVRLMSGTTFYNGKDEYELADEFISHVVERAFKNGGDVAGTLANFGIKDENIVNFISNIYNEREESVPQPGGNETGSVSDGTADSGDGSVESAESGAVEGQGSRPAGSGERVRAKVAADPERFISGVGALYNGNNEPVEANGILIADKTDDGNVRFNVRTWEEGGRDILAGYLAKQVAEGKLTQSEADNFLAEMDRLATEARHLADDDPNNLFGQWAWSEVRKKDGTNIPVLHAMKSNAEYDLNIDFSTVCKKRQVINDIFNKMISDGKLLKEKLSDSDIARINQIIQAHGLEIACGICFVDSKRYNAYKFADGFMDKFNTLVANLLPGRNFKKWQDAVDVVAGFNYAEDEAFSNVGKFDLTQVDEVVDWSEVFTIKGDNTKALAKYDLDWSKVYNTLKPLYDKARKNFKGSDAKFVEWWEKNGEGEPTEMDRWNYEVKSVLAHKNAEARMALQISQVPALRKLAKAEDFIASVGWTNVMAQNEELETLWNVQKGAAGARANEDNTQYLNDVLEANVNGDIFDIGGYRMQSFSDFIGRMYFDYYQAFADLAARQLPGHAYTKEPNFVKLFGLMGMKVNMSLVSDVDTKVIEELGKDYAGLTYGPDGKLTYYFYETIRDAEGNILRQGQTFPAEQAYALQADPRYSTNCGTIAVGLSKYHILMMLHDKNIRMVIPYHKSGLPHGTALVYNLREVNNYEPVQNTRGGESHGKMTSDKKKIMKKRVDNYNFNLHQLSIAEDKLAAYNALRLLQVKGLNGKFGDASKWGQKAEFKDIHKAYEFLYDAIRNGEITEGLQQREFSERFDSEDFIPKVAADIYQEACKSWDYIPKFDEFADEQAYYKVLIDFSVYDHEGNYTPQRSIKFQLPENVNELVAEALAEDESINEKKMQELGPVIADIEAYLGDRVLRQEQDRIAAKDDDKITEKERNLMGTNIYNVGDPRNALSSATNISSRAIEAAINGEEYVESGVRAKVTEDSGVRFAVKKTKALETDSPQNKVLRTAISSASGAKILNNLDILAEKYENSQVTNEKTFIGNVAEALGIEMKDKTSKYADFECVNGEEVTIRLSNHNATASNLDVNGQENAISLVISTKPNTGIIRDGDAHIIEYYYNAIKLRKAEGKPLADIVRSIKQSLYSGVYNDPTGLAEVEEINIRFKVANDNQSVFVSNALRAMDKIPMKKGNAQAWINKLQQAGGLKKEEDKWLGLSQWLQEQKGDIAKEDVAQFIAEHQIRIEETHYADDADLSAMDAKYPGFSDAFEVDTDMSGEHVLYINSRSAALNLYEQFGDGSYDVDDMDDEEIIEFGLNLMSEDAVVNPINETRRNYSTDGLENKREIALTVPTIAPYKKTDDIHFGDAGQGRAVAWVRFGDVTTKTDNAKVSEASKAYRDYKSALEEAYIDDFNNGLFNRLSEEERAELARLEKEHEDAYDNNTDKRVLVIDEVQSKRHQDGKDKGYRTADEQDLQLAKADEDRAFQAVEDFSAKMAEKYNCDPADWTGYVDTDSEDYVTYQQLYADYLNAGNRVEQVFDETRRGVPDAPFRENWHELAMKRMLRLAAEEGYDKIAWTNGEMQADRYNIGNKIREIRYDGIYTPEGGNEQKIFNFNYSDKGSDYTSGNYDQVITDAEGNIVMGRFEGHKLQEVVGKELTSKMLEMQDKGSTISGDGLRVGGDGMRFFYDHKLVGWMNKYGKQWGVKVEDITLPGLQNEEGWHSIDVNEAMKDSVMDGQVMFKATYEVQQEFAPRFAEIRSEYEQKKANILGHSGRFTPEEWRAHREELAQIGAERDARMQELNAEYDAAMTAAEEEDRRNAPVFDKVGEANAERGNALFAAAKEQFGTTTDLNEAGYIVPDGEMIDLSGKNNGGEAGHRQNDHRDINSVITDRKYETATEYMEDFINEGAIRIAPEVGLVTLANKPTKEQRDALRNYLYKHSNEGVEVEIYKGSESVANPQYRERTAPSRILGDINEYFDNGVVPAGNVMFKAVEITPEVRAEMDNIIANAKENGTYMKAPNGQPTKLTEEQWAMVRTQNFKNWFGDWENDPENASKVVDENGEPMVMKHVTHAYGFNKFFTGNGEALYFTGSDEYAKQFLDYLKQDYEDYVEPDSFGVYEVFLNVRNPFDAHNQAIPARVKDYFSRSDEMKDTTVAIEEINDFGGSRILTESGYDGAISDDMTVVVSPNQIKSATSNNGEFSRENNDIRFKAEDNEEAAEIYDMYENGTNGIMTMGDVVDMIDANDDLMEDGDLADMVDMYRTLQRQNLREGMRDFAGGEMEDLFNEQILPKLRELAGDALDEDGRVRFRFIGTRGAARLDESDNGKRRANAVIAQQMEFDGKSPLEIKMATGWERGADDRWRYEEPDFQLKEGVVADILAGKDAILWKNGQQMLTDVIDANDPLFVAYPDLKDIKVYVVNSRNENSAGAFGGDYIMLNMAYLGNSTEVRRTLIHEVQHAIQRIEKFAKGGNPMEEDPNAANKRKELEDRKFRIEYRLDQVNGKISEFDYQVENAIRNGMVIVGARSEDEYYNMLSGKSREEVEAMGLAPVLNAIKEARDGAQNLVQTKEDLSKELSAIEDELYNTQTTLGYSGYRRLAGEVEARNAQARMNMSEEERRNTLASETEDFAREDQIVRFSVKGNITRQGLEKALGEEYSDFMVDRIYTLLPDNSEALGTIARMGAANGGNFAQAAAEYYAGLADKKDLTDEDKAVIDVARKAFVALEPKTKSGNDVEWSDNDVLWAMYDQAHRHDTTLAEQRKRQEMKRELGKADSVEGNYTLDEILSRAEADKDDLLAQMDAYKAILDELSGVRSTSIRRGSYDRKTAMRLSRLANILISSKMDGLRKSEIKSMLSDLSKVKTTNAKDLQEKVDNLVYLMLDNLVRNLEGKLETLEKTTAVKSTSKKVTEQGALDIQGQQLMKTYLANKGNMSIDDGSIADKISKALGVIVSKSATEEEKAKANAEYLGLALAKFYQEEVQPNIKAIEDLEEDLEDEKKKAEAAKENADKKESRQIGSAYRDLVKTKKRSIASSMIKEATALTNLVQALTDITKGSHQLALNFLAQQKQRQQDIMHDANSDMEGIASPELVEEKALKWYESMQNVFSWFTQSLGTFDQILRAFGSKSVNGEGYLWNRFMRGWVNAAEAEQEGLEASHLMLDAKAKEVFGVDKWSDIYGIVDRLPMAEVSFMNGKTLETRKLDQSKLLYIVLANRMDDGAMKLQKMGISQETADEIEGNLDPRILMIGNWIVNEFLPARRDVYNEVHQRLFGAPMDSIESYFPLVIAEGAIEQKEDTSRASNENSNPSDITGSIIKRTKNTKALDILNANAFSIVLDHVKKMEHWAAFAEWNRDISSLLSYRHFRNQVVTMNSIYGIRKDLWREFKNLCHIAAGTYTPKTTKNDKKLLAVSSGVTAAKVSIRIWTALKQTLSAPAFLAETINPADYILGIGLGWNWCFDNLPLFRKRVKSRQLGDHILAAAQGNISKLQETLAYWGMTPNALVDAFTVSVGAYAMYRHRRAKYIKMGYPEEVAEKKAKQDASILYNETQQSSESAFVSVMQSDRTVMNNMFTIFRNSSMGYTRQVYDAARNLERKLAHPQKYKRESIAFMQKMLEREGLKPGDALKGAKRLYNRQTMKDIVRISIFGFTLPFLWNLATPLLYLIFGKDDDDKKKTLADSAISAAVGGWFEGLAGGNYISEGLSALVLGEDMKNTFNPVLPVVSDINTLRRKWGNDRVSAINDLICLASQILTGTNVQVLEDFVIACIDASNGDLGLAKEAAFWTMRVLSVPQSTIQKLYFEQIGLKAEEADAMSAQQLVERYAKYKMRRAGGAIAFAYNDEQLENKIAKYSSDAADYVSSAIIRENADREFFSVFDSLKDMEKKINELRQDNSKKSREKLTKIYLSRDYSVYQWFMPMVDSIAEESANFLKAKDQEEGLKHYNKANEIVDSISKMLRGEIQSDSYIKWQYMMLTEDWIPMVNDAVKSMKVTSDKDLKSQAEKIALENEKKINSLDSVYHVDYCKPVENPKVGKDGRLHEWSYPREFTEERNAIKREKDSIASVGTTKDKVMKYLKANPTAAGIIPEDIAETDEMIAYAYALSQGWFKGKKYVHDRIDKLQDKLAQETDPNERVRIQDKIDAETKIFSQQMVRILNHINGDDDGFEGIPD